MEWWQIAIGIAVGCLALIAGKYLLRLIITFVAICHMSPVEYAMWKLSNSIFDWDD